MIKKYTGYFFLAIGALSFGYFLDYKGTVIPYPGLFLIGSLLLFFAGIFLVYLSIKERRSVQDDYNAARIARLKQSGEKIMLTVDNCEIRENNYYKEIDNSNNSRMNQIDTLYEPNRNYCQQYIEQSAIIYHYESGGKKYRMTSQSFSCNASVLKQYIADKMLALYINRDNRNDYVFDYVG